MGNSIVSSKSFGELINYFIPGSKGNGVTTVKHMNVYLLEEGALRSRGKS